MTDTKSLSERLRLMAQNLWDVESKTILEAADVLDAKDMEIAKLTACMSIEDWQQHIALDAKNAEIERLREALRNVDAKVLEDLDRATRNRGARVAT